MRRLGVLLAMSIGLASTRLVAEGPQTASRFSGGADFQVFCASCHGTAGKGDGVLAGVIRKRPADLTQIAIKKGGVYPADAVFKVIDGGREHTDMPAWVEVFAKSQESAGAEAAKERIETLVKYLKTIQEKR